VAKSEILRALRQLPLGVRGSSRPALERPRACGCGAPRETRAPICNRVDADTEPELPEDFVADIRWARGD
jgi:hypothetical protein